MSGAQLQTPVALLIFNRPETTIRVFDEIRRARPTRLLVVADGPRPSEPDESERCRAAREVVERVDWPCEVATEYSDENLGCRRRISSGLDWVFEKAEEAIVLEDDTVPHPSFFGFCAELLARYWDDDHVMHISGDNFLGIGRGSVAQRVRHQLGGSRRSYYFSRYPHVWGWASWRRAWRHYDVELTRWKTEPDKNGRFLSQFRDPIERSFWRRTWDACSRGEIDTWDYQWAFACLARGGLSIMPNRNLVSNVGFGRDAAHTTGVDDPLANMATGKMGLPLRHPRSVSRDPASDAHTAGLFFRAV